MPIMLILIIKTVDFLGPYCDGCPMSLHHEEEDTKTEYLAEMNYGISRELSRS